jgi:hypothetical protein
MVAKTMKLKSSTIALMAIALLSVGGIYLWDQSHTAQDAATNDKKAAKPLFDLKETDITQLTIESKTPTLKLEKTEKGWQLITPKAGPANEGTSEQTLQVEPTQLKDFGLDQPTATLSLQLKNQKTHQVILGKQNFNQSAVYAQIDPDTAAKKKAVVLVPTGFLDAINRPLSEWQVKASSPKPTASPSPSATSK